MLDRCVVVFVTFAFFAKISFFFLSMTGKDYYAGAIEAQSPLE